MGRSRRKYKKSRPKVQVGLPKKHPRVFKPNFSLPPKLRSIAADIKWDDKGSVIQNYKSFGVVSNPNFLGVRSRTSHIVESDSLQVPPPQPPPDAALSEFEPLDSGSDLEEDGASPALTQAFTQIRVKMCAKASFDVAEVRVCLTILCSIVNADNQRLVTDFDLKSALGKKRRDGKSAPLQPLTRIQRLHIRKLVEKYGDDYQSMFMDSKLNKMQHSVGTLEKLCKRYHMYKDKNPLIVGC
ncbi:hypothetical protein RHGRI_035586 [Rhododendron griersonianum]|uniref:Nucleolar protein 16 n=1 Tax=Rhododendron griersonianum TaxID=479676 RepID=A0AAV6HMP3_9ERIC|nr:hypothetical protein RHGRI_035586 [Rhododendron griersonianum]